MAAVAGSRPVGDGPAVLRDRGLIESILLFSLGFLTAGFLALLVAPTIWRRAVALTRKRVEATVPLSMAEVQADKDSLRAEHALAVRKLEMSLKSLREKSAEQAIELDRQRDANRHALDGGLERDRSIAELNAKISDLKGELERRAEQLAKSADLIAEAEKALDERDAEIAKLEGMYDEAALATSSRQIELAAREADIELRTTEMGAVRAQRKDAESRLRQLNTDAASAQEALKAERKRAGDLEKRVERIMATVADREEKLDRREKELARLRDELGSGSRGVGDLEASLTESHAERVKLEAEVAELTLQMSKLVPGAGGEARKSVARLEHEKARLEERLTRLLRENRKLREKQTPAQGDEEVRQGDAILRDQIGNLAAEVVRMAEVLDGPDSPVRKIIDDGDGSAEGSTGKIASLADRVRALRKSASAG